MKQGIIKKQYCQSCGMPLRFDVEEYMGTNDGGSRSDEYCYYCLKEGKYTVDIPMSEMVDIWVKYTDKYNDYSGTDYSPEELRTVLNKRMPTLKRWRQKEITNTFHHEVIGNIKTYIDQNLHKEIEVNELCKIANLSHFHLRRIFKDITGENIGSYIQRLRLENVAHMLISMNSSINEIVKQTCYETKFSLAKAFKKHFGITMSAFRKRYANTDQEENNITTTDHTDCEIKRLKLQKAVCYPVDNAFRNKEEYRELWNRITHFKENYIKVEKGNNFISLSLDNTLVTPLEQCRFYIGVTVTEEMKQQGKFIMHEIPGGLYAIFRHKGSYAQLPELYRYIYENWLPANNYYPKNSLSFEVYLTLPSQINDVSELLTDVYIPIKKKQ